MMSSRFMPPITQATASRDTATATARRREQASGSSDEPIGEQGADAYNAAHCRAGKHLADKREASQRARGSATRVQDDA
jgi:hypothetical protein